MITRKVERYIKACIAGIFVLGLLGCASGSDKPKPSDLGPNPALLGVRLAWTSKIGMVDFPLDAKVVGQTVALASSEGIVLVLDSRTGVEQWRYNVGAPIAAGVGSDGHFVAIVTRNNELVTMDSGRELWRTKMPAQVFTAPLVAGDRVFVLSADRSMTAFDAQSGRKLWQNQRPGDALVLRQAGVLIAVQNTLVVGMSGRMLGLNPGNGNTVWDTAISTPRGTNDIERLVDLVAGVSREANVVCARAFQSAVGCVDATRGTLTWKRPAVGAVGLHGDDTQIYGSEEDGRLLAWRRSDGEPVWTSDKLRYRHLSPPLVLGRSIAVGDEMGQVHLMSRSDGSILTRLSTDGSAIAVAPVVASGTLVVTTRNGGVFGFQPE